jgi:hypothetical protein
MLFDVRQENHMRLPSSSAGLLFLAYAPLADAGVVGYLGSYFLHREYAARHAPYAVTRAPREWIAGDAVIVTIKNSTIMWMRLAPKTKREEFERRFLEPTAYYIFMPLVEADCALNGHPASPSYEWAFFGRNLE